MKTTVEQSSGISTLLAMNISSSPRSDAGDDPDLSFRKQMESVQESQSSRKRQRASDYEDRAAQKRQEHSAGNHSTDSHSVGNQQTSQASSAESKDDTAGSAGINETHTSDGALESETPQSKDDSVASGGAVDSADQTENTAEDVNGHLTAQENFSGNHADSELNSILTDTVVNAGETGAGLKQGTGSYGLQPQDVQEPDFARAANPLGDSSLSSPESPLVSALSVFTDQQGSTDSTDASQMSANEEAGEFLLGMFSDLFAQIAAEMELSGEADTAVDPGVQSVWMAGAASNGAVVSTISAARTALQNPAAEPSGWAQLADTLNAAAGTDGVSAESLAEYTRDRPVSQRMDSVLLPLASSAQGAASGVYAEGLKESFGTTASSSLSNTLLTASVSLQAGGASVRTAAASAPTPTVFTLPEALRGSLGQPEWQQAIGEKVAQMASQRLTEAEIQLDPPELGQLQVRVSVNQEHASVTFVSQHAAVREALDQSAFRLREMFAGEGLNLVDVDVSDQSPSDRQDSGDGDDSSRLQAEGGESAAEDGVEATASVELKLVDQFV